MKQLFHNDLQAKFAAIETSQAIIEFTPDGEPTHFLAFEREVARRRGRPGSGVAGRFEPVSVPDSDLPAALRSMAVFASLPPAAE